MKVPVSPSSPFPTEQGWSRYILACSEAALLCRKISFTQVYSLTKPYVSVIQHWQTHSFSHFCFVGFPSSLFSFFLWHQISQVTAESCRHLSASNSVSLWFSFPSLFCRFILSALSASQRNMVNCALCHRALPVFEQFPLVDGTLFLSPSRHDEIEYDVPCHLQGQTGSGFPSKPLNRNTEQLDVIQTLALNVFQYLKSLMPCRLTCT